MNTTYKVFFWEIKKRAGNRKRPYPVRWRTDIKEHSEWYANRALANSRLAELTKAARDGEPFDVETGLPVSELRQRNACTLLELAQKYVPTKWPEQAANSRRSTIEALATACSSFVLDNSGRPDIRELRRVLTVHLLPPIDRQDALATDDEWIVNWLIEASRPVTELSENKAVRELLGCLAVNLDGLTAAATVIGRKRAVMHNLLSYAVEQELLVTNPLTGFKWKQPKRVEQVDPRVVINLTQARELLTAVTYVGQRNVLRGAHLVGFFGTIYYGAARPGEVANLRDTDCKLPERGWGELTLWGSRPSAGSRWTDSGEVHDCRSLKHRPEGDTRIVPIPPMLVKLLKEHIERFGLATDGRLFQSPNGAVVGASTYARVWEAARTLALTPAQVASPLAGRPYDLRHAAVSAWLNAGVPAAEVAERAGHSIEVLMKVYAKCVYGERDLINARIQNFYEL